MASKSKIQLEYSVNCSPAVLYHRLNSAAGLAEWFADDVRVKGTLFTFIWNGSEMQAEMVQSRDGKQVRFNWVEDEEDSYFEFRISKDELTGDVSLTVTDFAEEGEEKGAVDLWNMQIADLKRNLGC
ncbi:MAG: START-like domain-containing protein [Mangrovibacterium sp.]|jgi:uncharacterized protein YndB with AHSA1/START domain